jgi:hemoglobin-like flavoprotein
MFIAASPKPCSMSISLVRITNDSSPCLAETAHLLHTILYSDFHFIETFTHRTMVDHIEYHAISSVIACWEHANQKYSSREEIGNAILLHLFEVEPETKLIFGFQPSQNNIETNPMLRMGLMVHGIRIVHMIDQVLTWLGPDCDVVADILRDLGQRHSRYGVKKEHFALMGVAIRGALSKILDEKQYTKEVDMAWKEIFDKFSMAIVQSMP